MSLYPLQFQPRFVKKIWGGRKIETVLNKPLPPGESIGESWELYDFPPGVVENSTAWASSVVVNGPLAGRTLHDLIGEYGRKLHGEVSLLNGEQFPILIKFLDACEDLSVQVHPPASYADRHPGTHLKTEAWYILQHEPEARILKGLTKGATRQSFEAGIVDNRVESQIQSIPVKVGDCHFLPSGTVHALGGGILAAEVQTPSDTTFRVYDFGRLENGKPRQLHIQEALACIDFDAPSPPPQRRSHVGSYFTTVTQLVDCPYFKIEKVRMTEGVHEAIPYDQPVVWIMLEGEAQLRVADQIEAVTARKGQTLLLPAVMNKPTIQTQSDCTWLEVTFPIPRS